jgi:hypothetical protein
MRSSKEDWRFLAPRAFPGSTSESMGSGWKIEDAGIGSVTLKQGNGYRESGSAGEKLLSTINWVDHEAHRGSERRWLGMSFLTDNLRLWEAILDRCHKDILHLQVEVGDRCWTCTRACLLPTSVNSTLDSQTATI